MAFGKVDTSRTVLTDVVAGTGAFADEIGVDKNYAAIPVSRASDETLDVLGLVVIWDNVEASFRAFNDANATIAETTFRSDLPTGSELAVVVSATDYNLGGNEADVTLGTTDTNLMALYRGDAAVKFDGLVFDGTTSAANKLVARKALERAGIVVVDNADVNATSHLS